MAGQHTKGPWGVWLDEEANQFKVFSDQGRGFGETIANIVGVRGAFKANAHLIAAAPDLLAALSALMDSQRGLNHAQWLAATEQARAAVAKARGNE